MSVSLHTHAHVCTLIWPMRGVVVVRSRSSSLAFLFQPVDRWRPPESRPPATSHPTNSSSWAPFEMAKQNVAHLRSAGERKVVLLHRVDRVPAIAVNLQPICMCLTTSVCARVRVRMHLTISGADRCQPRGPLWAKGGFPLGRRTICEIKKKRRKIRHWHQLMPTEGVCVCRFCSFTAKPDSRSNAAL